ncbi:MAG: polysaccharide biosynthesis tyrosine autokinase [Planctomycetota bacterium]|nr:MAG: polysaccharide biosynthesis tyrosine autokinase [Planctomycetota bacterium]
MQTNAQPVGPRPGPAPPPRPAGAGAGPATIDPLKLLRQYAVWLVVAAVVGAGLGVGAHFALLKIYPLYRAEIAFEMFSPINDPAENISTVEGNAEEIDRFIGGQLFILESEDLWLDAVRNDNALRTQTKWIRRFTSPQTGQIDENEVVRELADVVSAYPVRESNVVILQATTTDGEDAAIIATAIRNAYIRSNEEAKSQNMQDVLSALSGQLRAVQEERRLAQERMEQLLTENQITSLDERIAVFSADLTALLPGLVEINQSVEVARDTLRSYEEQLASPGGATYPESVRADVRQHPTMLRYESLIADLEADLLAKRARLGDANMQTRATRHQLDAVREAAAAAEERLLEEIFVRQIEEKRSELRSLEAAQIEAQAAAEEARRNIADTKRIQEEYRQLDEDATRLAEQELSLQSEIEKQRAIINRRASSRVRELYSAEVPDRPIFPRIEFIAPAGVILVLVLTAGLIVLRELLEKRVRTPQDVALIPRTRVLGVVPDADEDPSKPTSAERAVADAPAGVLAESVRQIRTLVLKRFAQRGHKALLVVGGMPGSGATTTVANLASSLANADLRVLVIDGNFRRPKCHAVFGVAEGPGLGEALAGAVALTDAAQPTEDPNVHVVTAGAPGTRVFERLATPAMSRLLDEARARYDLVLIDSPPAIVAGDAMALANRCDAAVLVVRAFSETRGLVARVRDQLDESRAEFLGVVVNAVRSAAGGYFRRNFRTAHEYQNGLASELRTARAERLGAGATDD